MPCLPFFPCILSRPKAPLCRCPFGPLSLFILAASSSQPLASCGSPVRVLPPSLLSMAPSGPSSHFAVHLPDYSPPPPRLSPLYSALVAPENTSTNFGTLAKRAVGCWYLMSLSSPRKVSSLQEHPWHPLHVCLARDAPRSLEESSFFLQRRACSLFRTLGFDFTEVSRSFLATGGCPLLMDFASKEDSRKEVWPQAPRELAARGHLRSVVESTELHFLRLREVAFLV